MLRRAYGPRSIDQLALPKQAAGVLLLRAKHLFVAANVCGMAKVIKAGSATGSALAGSAIT